MATQRHTPPKRHPTSSNKQTTSRNQNKPTTTIAAHTKALTHPPTTPKKYSAEKFTSQTDQPDSKPSPFLMMNNMAHIPSRHSSLVATMKASIHY
mmetsp:Transcript_5706/g.8845  ORF Transcript_5706/g.8845 Transcript_5706/m.8845 type:complete len:95 (+) Transcript_5706:450-734(+)